MEFSYEKPLEGVRVLALVTNVPGPIAAASLARLGAEVTKVESPAGDSLEPAAARWYAEIVRDLRVLRLDLKCASATLLAELAKADVLITAMRARSLKGAGLEWGELHAKFPRLAHVAIVGEAAPNDDRAGHDLTYQARANLIAPPAMPRTLFADMFAAERTVAAALLALYERERTGAGSRHEIAIADGARVLSDPVRHGLTSAEGALGGGFAGYAIYRTADGWIALAALEPHFQQRLLRALDLPAIDAAALRKRFAERENAYWEMLAGKEDLPLATIAAP